MEEIGINEEEALEIHTKTMEEIAHKLRWASHHRLDQQLEQYNLTIPQFTTLRILSMHEKTWRMSDLSEAAHQVMPTMTGIIDRLVERKLVQRTRDPEDRRALCITLTQEGQQILQNINRIKHAEMARFLSALSLNERETMINLMTRYLDDIQNSLEKRSRGEIG